MVAEEAEWVNTLQSVVYKSKPNLAKAESLLFTTTASWRFSKCSTHPQTGICKGRGNNLTTLLYMVYKTKLFKSSFPANNLALLVLSWQLTEIPRTVILAWSSCMLSTPYTCPKSPHSRTLFQQSTNLKTSRALDALSKYQTSSRSPNVLLCATIPTYNPD